MFFIAVNINTRVRGSELKTYIYEIIMACLVPILGALLKPIHALCEFHTEEALLLLRPSYATQVVPFRRKLPFQPRCTNNPPQSILGTWPNLERLYEP